MTFWLVKACPLAEHGVLPRQAILCRAKVKPETRKQASRAYNLKRRAWIGIKLKLGKKIPPEFTTYPNNHLILKGRAQTSFAIPMKREQLIL